MKTKESVARATMRLPESLWTAVQHRAVDEDSTLAEVAERALRDYLKKPAMTGLALGIRRQIDAGRMSFRVRKDGRP